LWQQPSLPRRSWPYAIGALSAGLIADFFGFAWAIGSIAMLTFASGTVAAKLMHSPKMTAKSRGTNDPVTSH
jgi:hypothetical protein